MVVEQVGLEQDTESPASYDQRGKMKHYLEKVSWEMALWVARDIHVTQAKKPWAYHAWEWKAED